MTEVSGKPTSDSTLVLHRLATRPDGAEIIVGRVDTGDFAAVPAAGAIALELLADGHTIGQAQRELHRRTGTSADVTAFAETLVAYGFVAEIDGRPVSSPASVRPTLSRLRANHVRWLLSPVLWTVVAAVIVTAIVLLLSGAASLPRYRHLLWTDRGSIVLLGQVVLGWSLVAVHELAHLATARAAGVPGRIGLGTRLQFLVAQTDISGIWAVRRRHRLAAYGAGMAVDATIAATAFIVSAAAGGHGAAHRVAMIVAISTLIPLSWQLLIFMRTDVYFILQDLTRCRNLYADGTAYARYLARRTISFARRGNAPLSDPSSRLSPRERRTVRLYAALLVPGTVGCVALAVFITVPFELHIIGRAVRDVAAGDIGPIVDGAVVLLLLSIVHGLWLALWWRRIVSRRRGGSR